MKINHIQKQITMTKLPGTVIYIYGIGDSILVICSPRAKAYAWFIQALQPQTDTDPPSQQVKSETKVNANGVKPFHGPIGQIRA